MARKVKHADDVGTLAKESCLGRHKWLLDEVYLGCTQRAAQVNKRIVMEKQIMFSELISTKTDVKPEETNPKDITAWSYDMEGHTQKCVNAIANWRTRRLTNFMRFAHLVCAITEYKTEDQEIVGEWSETFSLILLK